MPLLFTYNEREVRSWNPKVCPQSSFSVNRSFCQICKNCIRIKKISKKLTSNRTWILDSRTDCAAHFLSPMPYPCARSHCLKDWDFNDPYVVMLYWFLELRGLSWNQFFYLIQFWQIWQNDLFTEKLECGGSTLCDVVVVSIPRDRFFNT